MHYDLAFTFYLHYQENAKEMQKKNGAIGNYCPSALAM